MTVANFNWKKGLLLAVGLLFAGCCGIGAIASKNAPTETAQKPVEATRAVPTVIPTSVPTEVPCDVSVARWKKDMREVMSTVMTAGKKADESKMKDAQNVMAYAIDLLSKTDVPTCDERAQTVVTTMNKGLMTMLTQYIAMENGDVAMANVYGTQAIQEINAATDILSDLNKDYPNE